MKHYGCPTTFGARSACVILGYSARLRCDARLDLELGLGLAVPCDKKGVLRVELWTLRLVFVHALIVNQGGRGEGVFPHLSQKQYQPFWATHVRSTLHTVIYIYMYIRPVTMRLYG